MTKYQYYIKKGKTMKVETMCHIPIFRFFTNGYIISNMHAPSSDQR